MVKNLNTVERGEKVRIGKLQPHTQAENSVIVNASDTTVQAPHSGTFVSPIRYDTVATTNVLAYDTATNEIVTTQVVAVDKTLQYVTETGNTTTEVVQFTNGFVSSGPVGLAGNTEPAHSLDIGSNVYIDDTSSSGNVFFARGNVYIEGNLTTFGETTLIYSQNISVKDPIIELGQNNVNENLLYDLGVLMKRPGENVGVVYREAQDEVFVGYTPNTASERFITSSSNLVTMNVVGDVYANAYFGDGRTLTGVAFKAHLEDNVSRIEVLETDATSNALRVSNLETQMTSNGIRVGNLESNLAANSVRVSNLEFNLQNNSQRISTLTAYHTSNVLRIQDLEANVNTNIHTRLNNLESNLTDNSNRITTLSARLEDNSFRISVNTANIANLQVTSSNNFANIALLQTYALSNSIRVTTLETSLQSNALLLNDAVSNLAANSVRISALEVLPDQLADNSARISALEVDPEFEGIITGDGGNISNLTLQYISDMGNTTSNTLHLTGGVSLKTDGFVGINVEPQYELHVGGDIQVDGNLNSTYFTTNGTLNRIYGNTLVDGNTTIQGNLVVHGSTSYLYSENVFIRDPILGLGNNGLADTGIIIGVQSPANVVFGYDASETEFIVAHSTASVDGVSLTPDPSNPINFHVYGDVEANTITSQADVIVGGNLEVRGNTTFLQVDNLAVDDAIIKIAAGNELTTLDSGVVMERAEANVAMVYRGHEDELMFAYTTDDAAGVDITPDLSKHMNVHVYGSFFADKSINVNSNTFISETGEVTANIYFGDGGLLSNITQTLQGITDIGNTTTQTLHLTNETEAINATSNIVTDGYYFGNGEFLTGISNTLITNEYITSNVNILNDNIDSNISTVRDYITSNVNILNDNISSNLSTARDYITSNVNILNENIDSNISTVRDYISSNVDILNDNIDSNLETVRTYITSNVNILNDNIDSNLETVRTYITSNVNILNDNIDSNLSTVRDYISSNVDILNENIDSNLETTRTYITSNVNILNDNIDSNISTARDYISSNVKILNDYIALKSNILDPHFTSNVNIESNVTTNELAVSTLTAGRVPYVGTDSFLVDHEHLTFTQGAPSLLSVGGDVNVSGNLFVQGSTTFLHTTNTVINDALVELANNNTSDTLDMGFIMTRPTSNVGLGFRGDESEFMIGHTLSDPSSADLVPDSGNDLAVHVYGSLEVDTTLAVDTDTLYVNATDDRVGVNTTTPGVALDVRGDANVAALSVHSNVDVGTDNFFVDTNSGRVGIGTTLPIFELDVSGDANVATINVYTIQGLQTMAFNSDNTTTPPLQLTAGSLSDGIGAIRIDSVEPDIYLNDTNGGFATVTFANNDVQRAAFGRNSADDFYITVRDPAVDSGNWKDTTLVVDSSTGNITMAYKLGVNTTTFTGSNVLEIGGTANAAAYYGDGGLLSNIASTLDDVCLNGNTTTQVVSLLNTHTALTTDLTSNVEIKLDQLSNVVIGDDLTAEQRLIYDGANWVNDFNDNNFIRVINKTGVDIAKGDTLYIVDSHNNNIANVALAKSDSSATMPCIGVASDQILNDAEGLAVTYGKVSGVNTVGFTQGQTLYVSNTTPGGIMASKPYDTVNDVDQIQNLGICIKENSENNGIIFVTGIGRSNDIPNANIVTQNSQLNYVYVNNVNNDMLKIDPTHLLTKLQTLQQVTDTGATTTNEVSFTNTDTWSIKASGNIYAESNITALEYYGDGTKLTGVALKTDLTDNAARVSVLEANVVDLWDNVYSNATILDGATSNISVLQSNVVDLWDNVYSNASTLATLKTDHEDNVLRIGVLEANVVDLWDNVYSNASTLATLKTDHEDNVLRIGVLEANVVDLWDNVYSNATILDGAASNISVLQSNVVDLWDNVYSNAARLDTAEDDISDLENTRATKLDPTFTSNITVNNVAYVNNGLVVNNTRFYAHSGSMTNPSDTIGLEFASNVFYARVMAQLVYDTEDVNTLVLELQGGKVTGAPTKNITVGTLNKFGDTTKPWSSTVTTTPTEVTIQPNDLNQDYDYEIMVEYTSAGTDSKLVAVKEGSTAVKNFAY